MIYQNQTKSDNSDDFDDLLDDGNSTSRKRKKKPRLQSNSSSSQAADPIDAAAEAIMCETYATLPYINPVETADLAQKTGLSERTIKTWFAVSTFGEY